MRVGGIAFRKLIGHCRSIFAIYQRIRTSIMTLTKTMLSAFIIGTHYFRIFSDHPSRKCCCGSGKYNIIIFFRKHLYDLIQFRKVVFMLRRLNLCPGEYINRSAVDPRIFEDSHIFFPYFLRPLIWIIISSIKNSFEFWLHKTAPFVLSISIIIRIYFVCF